jgi:hypothetical protein
MTGNLAFKHVIQLLPSHLGWALGLLLCESRLSPVWLLYGPMVQSSPNSTAIKLPDGHHRPRHSSWFRNPTIHGQQRRWETS